ncbi:scavenger receptor cysteine-rich type 1 protein M130 isoform X3 [Oreochromis niloticus]|uniref:scavenger receptor cysteine-rich type 1 protein M130 isoform X3 n=1 Tax=Oreochromis niloticus TaxID=8128 RepID=UPI000DF1B0D6|nr:scavenger receptor cysteine-rich type 1 protein M130 isoform X3 [Oreochromis niloticus]
MDMNPLLLLMLLMLWSSGLQAEVKHNSTEFVRLVGGASRCAGTLELKHQGEWRPAFIGGFHMKAAAAVCEHLNCGFVVSLRIIEMSYSTSMWLLRDECHPSDYHLPRCVLSWDDSSVRELTCSDSVRLLNGTSLCSGRLEVNYNQSNQSKQSWTSMCEDHFDQQDAEVVCRELGCGPPSALQGELYGDVGAPVWSKEFQCEGHESTLLDCRSSNSTRNSCSPGKAVGLTCSEPIRLVDGASRCAGTLEVKIGEWRPVHTFRMTLKEAASICQHLNCGPRVSLKQKPSERPLWAPRLYCEITYFSAMGCLKHTIIISSSWAFPPVLVLTCSGSLYAVE